MSIKWIFVQFNTNKTDISRYYYEVKEICADNAIMHYFSLKKKKTNRIGF